MYDEAARKFMKNHHGGVILVDGHIYGHSDSVGLDLPGAADRRAEVARTIRAGQGLGDLRRRDAVLPD